VDHARTTLTLPETAWLYQVAEDTFYRRCRRGRVPYAFQVGRSWLVPVKALRRHLPRLAAELADALANGDIEVVRPSSRSAVPTPLAVYRWMSDSAFSSQPCPQGDEEACVHESESIAHLRTATDRQRSQ
jgi:hypothetical protein